MSNALSSCHTFHMRWLLLILLFLPFAFVSSQGLNAGFVKGVWYSKSPFFAGETVRIYTAIQNNSGADIEGKAVFLVDGNPVGEASFAAVNGRIVEVWTDWNVTEGSHSVAARITEAVRKEIGKPPEPIALDSLAAPADEVFADLDTDGDGIGNLEDEDDDNDGLADAQEQALGTSPLSWDSDGDGAADGAANKQETDPLLAEAPVQEPVKGKEQSPLGEFSKKLTDDYLGFGPQVDVFVEHTLGTLKGQRDSLQEQSEAFAAGESAEPLSAGEKALDFLLASAIVALPEWRFGLFLLFGLGLAFLARRLG